MAGKTNELKNQISNLIIECIDENKKLPTEQEMMETFSVSRFSLREVLSSFESSGIITSQRGSGRYAQYPDLGKQIKNTWSMFIDSKPTLLLDFLDIRTYMELSALPKVVLTIRPENLLVLRECINKMANCDTVSEAYTNADREFHINLYKCLGNTLLNQMISMYWDISDESIFWPTIDSASTLQMHEDILAAIASSDVDRAVAAMQTHFEDSRTQMTLALINK